MPPRPDRPTPPEQDFNKIEQEEQTSMSGLLKNEVADALRGLRNSSIRYLRNGNMLRNLRQVKLAEIPWLIRSWWRDSGWGSRIFGCLVVFLVLGSLLHIAGCDQTNSVDPGLKEKSSSDQISSILSSAKEYVQNADQVQSVNQAMKLRATYQSDPRMMIVQSPEGTIAVDQDGKRWSKRGSCWKADGAAEKPDSLNVLLPLAEEKIKFTSLNTQDSKKQILFQSESLGSWGPGEGQLTIQGEKPTQFRYMPDTGSGEYVFQISYPENPVIENLHPRC